MAPDGWNLWEEWSVPWKFPQLHLSGRPMMTMLMSMLGSISSHISHCQIAFFFQIYINLFILDCFTTRPCEFLQSLSSVFISELNLLDVELNCWIRIWIWLILFAFPPRKVYDLCQSWAFKRILLYHSADHIGERVIFGNFINSPMALSLQLIHLSCIVLLILRFVERFLACEQLIGNDP